MVTQALNFTAKALPQLRESATLSRSQNPLASIGIGYLVDKLRQAQVFVLPDHGEILDRGKARPVVPEMMFRPPFPVVALEYTSNAPRREHDYWTAARCSKRIALAWDWQDDLPTKLRIFAPPSLPPGVVIASLAYFDDQQRWLPMAGALHVSYEDGWKTERTVTPFVADMVAIGQISGAQSQAPAVSGSLIPILPEVAAGVRTQLGSIEAAVDHLQADLMDEVNAYLDMALALACRNVGVERQAAPEKLNRARLKGGKDALPDFHILTLASDGGGAGLGGGISGGGRRAHLRRGHIRRLGPDRVTWVNQTMVRGVGGFVDKAYRITGAAA